MKRLKRIIYVFICIFALLISSCGKQDSINDDEKVPHTVAPHGEKARQEEIYDDGRFESAKTVFDRASDYYFEINGLHVELGSNETDFQSKLGTDIHSGIHQEGQYYCTTFRFGDYNLALLFPEKNNRDLRGLYAFYASIPYPDSKDATPPPQILQFTDSLGFTLGEIYPDFYNDLVKVTGSDVIEYRKGYNSDTYGLYYDINGELIPGHSELSPGVCYTIEYTFLHSTKEPVLYNIHYHSKDLYDCISTFGGANLPDYLFEHRITGTYTGVTPEEGA